MPERNGAVTRREPIADATWAFHIESEEFPFRPGQTVDLKLPSPLYQDAAGNQRTFSLAAAPAAGPLLIATRLRGSAFKRSLVDAPLPVPVTIDGPFGSFTLPRRPAPVVLLAGGIGITPFRAMAEDAIARGLEQPLLLLHSNRTPAEAPFLDELRGWSAAHPGFTYLPTMTRADGSWSGERRRIAAELLAEALPADRNAALYYLAGPERFVRGVADELKTLGVDEDRVRAEEFPGY